MWRTVAKSPLVKTMENSNVIVVRLNVRALLCLAVSNCIKVLCGVEITFGKSKIRVLHFIEALYACCLFIIFNNVLLVQRIGYARPLINWPQWSNVFSLLDNGPSNRGRVIKFAAYLWRVTKRTFCDQSSMSRVINTQKIVIANTKLSRNQNWTIHI